MIPALGFMLFMRKHVRRKVRRTGVVSLCGRDRVSRPWLREVGLQRQGVKRMGDIGIAMTYQALICGSQWLIMSGVQGI